MICYWRLLGYACLASRRLGELVKSHKLWILRYVNDRINNVYVISDSSHKTKRFNFWNLDMKRNQISCNQKYVRCLRDIKNLQIQKKKHIISIYEMIYPQQSSSKKWKFHYHFHVIRNMRSLWESTSCVQFTI